VAVLVGATTFFLTSGEPTVQIETSPAGATILLDGFDTQQLSPATLPIAPGTHQLVLRLAGHEDSTSSIDVDGDTALSVALRPSRGALEVVSVPAGAMVFREGVLVGMTPVTIPDLADGTELNLTLQAPGFEPLTHAHRSVSGRRERTELRLVPISVAVPISAAVPVTP
jgi:hypothetical protein